ncbi:hypothetical protein [Nesterenkonia sp. CF4.4]|uniref:hypothetical protein n=1 Tax=Nesterenkonia sp. CF4.4 TaxID=3373079 RepID=UPI003EE6387D
MNGTTGRAGGNIRHLQHKGTKGTGNTREDRASLLHESMRELDDEAVQTHARLNPNIVPADSHLNVAMVNNGDGTFRRPKSIEEVLDYGDSRIDNVYRKWKPNSFETTLVVVHLPKTMCDEVPNYYPLLDKVTGQPVIDEETGEPKLRSRWVAKNRSDAIAYFDEVLAYYGSDVLTGGIDAIHGYDINFDESTPHIQIMADTLAPDPKHDGNLRVDASRMWDVHRDVTVDKFDATTGQPVIDEKTGEVVQVLEQRRAKMSRYQRGLREHMVAKGYPVEHDFDPERHLSGLGKDEYTEVMDSRRVVETQTAALKLQESDLDSRQTGLEDYQARLDEYRDKVVAGDQRLRDSIDIVEDEKARVAKRSTHLDEREQDVAQMELKTGAASQQISVELELVRQVRSALKHQREALEEREATIAEREGIIEDVTTFLDAMKSPAGETLRQRFDRFLEERRQQRLNKNEAAQAYVRAKARHWAEPEPRSDGPQLGG